MVAEVNYFIHCVTLTLLILRKNDMLLKVSNYHRYSI